jgi:acyl-CoA hydrolase/RimJ/RimL family protein N-acetyltransferase
MSWQDRYRDKSLSAAQAVSLIPRGKHVFIGSGAAEPVSLVEQLVAQAHRFSDNTLVHLLTLGPAPYVAPQFANAFRHNAVFIGPNVREAVWEGRADYTPVFLSQIPALMRSRRIPVDVALVQVSPPDAFGFVNLGCSVDVVLAAIESADVVIAEVNPRMPVVHGDGFVPMDRFSAWVEVDRPLLEVVPEPLDEAALAIGHHVASLVEDGATIQVGIGQIPNAVMKALEGKRDLGVWSEMISDGVMDLMQSGAVNGRFKRDEPGKVSASFCFGTQALYDFVHQNPALSFHPSDRINDPVRVARQHKMVAVNSALSIDLTGQVCSDSIGTRFYSGIGGQVDFIRGASMCPGGKPIIALRSTAKGGTISRITAALEPGAGVVTSRGDVRYVVTEHGIADLQGRSVRERAMELIGVAAPEFREELLATAKARRYIFADQIAPPASYPESLSRDVTLKDGACAHIRPLRVTDEPRLRDLFYCLDEDTVYLRWLRVLKRMPHRDLQGYVDVDYNKRMALVVEVADGSHEPEIVGVGRYHVVPSTGLADVAFVLRDDWQGRGLGSMLLRELIDAARDRGIEGFSADVLAVNGPMLHVFQRSGLRIESTLEDSVYHLTMAIPPRAPAARPSLKPAVPS